MIAPVVAQAVPAQAHATETLLHAEDKGYHKSLKPRQIQMIAIGGAIGTGLFLGAGGRLNAAAPPVIAYAACGFFAFLPKAINRHVPRRRQPDTPQIDPHHHKKPARQPDKEST